MSISSHLGIILLVIVGVVITVGVAAIGVVETRREEKGQPSIISGRKGDKAIRER